MMPPHDPPPTPRPPKPGASAQGRVLFRDQVDGMHPAIRRPTPLEALRQHVTAREEREELERAQKRRP